MLMCLCCNRGQLDFNCRILLSVINPFPSTARPCREKVPGASILPQVVLMSVATVLLLFMVSQETSSLDTTVSEGLYGIRKTLISFFSSYKSILPIVCLI